MWKIIAMWIGPAYLAAGAAFFVGVGFLVHTLEGRESVRNDNDRRLHERKARDEWEEIRDGLLKEPYSIFKALACWIPIIIIATVQVMRDTKGLRR